MYKIGVIIPVYKGRGKVEHALDTLVAQTFKDFEVCLSSDCDGESYEDIISEYACRGLVINHIIRSSRGGPGAARQSGISLLIDECEYLMFMDQDDYMMPIGLEYAYKAIENADVCQCTFIEETATQYIIHPGDNTPVTWHHGKIYRSKFLKDNKIWFDDRIFWNEDCYFNVVAMNTGTNLRENTPPLYLWKYNSESATHKDFENFFKKAWDTFIASQVLALLKVEEINPEKMTPYFCGIITCQMYNHFQRGMALKLDESQVYKWLDMLKKSKGYLNALKSQDFWVWAVRGVINTAVGHNKTTYFPTETILNWVKRLISTEVCDDLYS